MDLAETESEAAPVTGAKFWIRLIAHSIDLLIVLLFACMLMIPLAMRVMSGGSGNLNIPWWIEIPVDLALIAFVVIMWRYWQTTPGKRLFELKIVDSKTGERPAWGLLVVRYFGYLIAMLPIIPFKLIAPDYEKSLIIGTAPEGIMAWIIGVPLGFGFLWILIDPRNRGWHDLMSRTVTVSAKFGQTES